MYLKISLMIFMLIILILFTPSFFLDTPPFTITYSITTQHDIMMNQWYNAMRGSRGYDLEILPGDFTLGGHLHNQEGDHPKKIRWGFGVYDQWGMLHKDLGYWTGRTRVKNNGNIVEKNFKIKDGWMIPANYYWAVFMKPLGGDIPEGSSVNIDFSYQPVLKLGPGDFKRISTGNNTRVTAVEIDPELVYTYEIDNVGKNGGVEVSPYPEMEGRASWIKILYKMLNQPDDQPDITKEIKYDLIVDF